MASGCIECQQYLSQDVYDYSINHFGAPLCRYHQNLIRTSGASQYAIDLYFALKSVGVPAELEKYDGHKTIDIAIEKHKIHIEIDGEYHHEPDQALKDLQRTFYSFLDGYLTLRIPNSLIRYHFQDAVNYVIRFLNADYRNQLGFS